VPSLEHIMNKIGVQVILCPDPGRPRFGDLRRRRRTAFRCLARFRQNPWCPSSAASIGFEPPGLVLNFHSEAADMAR
jgi:hypothetical protein